MIELRQAGDKTFRCVGPAVGLVGRCDVAAMIVDSHGPPLIQVGLVRTRSVFHHQPGPRLLTAYLTPLTAVFPHLLLYGNTEVPSYRVTELLSY